MTSVTEMFGMRCPQCLCDDRLEITAVTTVRLTSEGTIEVLDALHEWSFDSDCTCGGCGFKDEAGRFTHFAEELP